MANFDVTQVQTTHQTKGADPIKPMESDTTKVEIGEELLKLTEQEELMEDVVIVNTYDKGRFSTWADFIEAYEFDENQYSKSDILKLIRSTNGYSFDKPMMPDKVALPRVFCDEYGNSLEGIVRKEEINIPRHDMPRYTPNRFKY